jgi:hypothetical protein
LVLLQEVELYEEAGERGQGTMRVELQGAWTVDVLKRLRRRPLVYQNAVEISMRERRKSSRVYERPTISPASVKKWSKKIGRVARPLHPERIEMSVKRSGAA